MADKISYWLGIAALNIVLATPAFALEESFGDQPATDAATPTGSVTASEPAAQPDNQITENDDPYTFNALRHITLRNLAVNADANQPESIKDPLQPINRKIFKFNQTIDTYVLLPVAKTYKKVMPSPVRTSVSNFFSNLREPWSAVNHLLQGHPKSSVKSLGRFTVNTLSSLGLADPATKLGITSTSEDFGQTLGTWGVKSGPFLMLPLLGPSTLRDTGGMVLDMYARPQHYINEDAVQWSLSGLQIVNLRAGLIGVEDLVQGDQYTLIRDLYLQRRQYAISGNKGSSPGIDESFGDDDDNFDGQDSSQSIGNTNVDQPELDNGVAIVAPTVKPQSTSPINIPHFRTIIVKSTLVVYGLPTTITTISTPSYDPIDTPFNGSNTDNVGSNTHASSF